MSDVRKPAGAAPVPGAVCDISTARKHASARSAPPSGQSDISEAGREHSQVQLAVEDPPGLRAGQVHGLRARIANGTYNPDPREIARSMLERGF